MGSLGLSKHRKSGKAANHRHFTGKKRKSKTVTRTGNGLTRKERRLKRGSHVNRYGLDFAAEKGAATWQKPL